MVSVIIPMYNAEDSIIRCLDSVINQTYDGKMEIIVVNDGSKDSSLKLVEHYVSTHNSLDIKVYSQINKGVSSARNLGLREAKGDYIALLDADDEWMTHKVELQINYFLTYPKYGFLGGLINDPKSATKETVSEIHLKTLFFKNYFQPSTVIFKREVLEKIGYFDETQKYAEEGNYFFRVAKNFTCGLINQKVIVYGQGKKGFGISGLSANLKEMEKGELKNLNFALKEGFISIPNFGFAVAFSLLKYLRRILIVKWNGK